MARRVKGARDVRELFALDNVVLQEESKDGGLDMGEGPSRLEVEIDVDTERLGELMGQFQGAAEHLQGQVEDLLNDFLGVIEDAADELDDQLEDAGEEAVGAIYELGSFVKSTLMDENKTTVNFSLAQKAPKAKQQAGTNYSKVAAGVTFGAIALFAVVGLANKRKANVRDYEESLL